jgi:hypothetical protein
MKKLALMSAIGALTLGLPASAQATPFSSTHVTQPAGITHAADYRRCWWHDGRRVCRYVYGYRDHGLRHHRWWRWRHRDRD